MTRACALGRAQAFTRTLEQGRPVQVSDKVWGKKYQTEFAYEFPLKDGARNREGRHDATTSVLHCGNGGNGGAVIL